MMIRRYTLRRFTSVMKLLLFTSCSAYKQNSAFLQADCL